MVTEMGKIMQADAAEFDVRGILGEVTAFDATRGARVWIAASIPDSELEVVFERHRAPVHVFVALRYHSGGVMVYDLASSASCARIWGDVCAAAARSLVSPGAIPPQCRSFYERAAACASDDAAADFIEAGAASVVYAVAMSERRDGISDAVELDTDEVISLLRADFCGRMVASRDMIGGMR